MSGVSQVSGRRRRKFRAASNRVDRISVLPEPLKLHILSLLPTTEDRIRTGALSRSWKDLWTSVPKLNFCFDYDLDEDNPWAPDDFVKHVEKTLNRILSCGTKVKEFVVKWPYYDDYSSDVDKWIRFAARNETEKFELDFDPWKGNIDNTQYYVLPEHIYSNSYFRSLRFHLCDFIIPLGTTVSWDSLKHLTIDYGTFDDESLAKIVAGAPALEFLDLCLEYGISKLHFGNSVLKKLVLDMGHYLWDNKEAALEISAPSVKSLEVSCCFKTCKLVDMTSLVEATLLSPFSNHDYPVLIQEVVSSLLNVKSLTVGTWIIQGIAKLPTNDVRPLFPKCKCLTVDTHLWKEDPIAIASLLKNTPEVETLIVTIADFHSRDKFRNPYGHVSSNIDQYWTSQEMGDGYLTCLRTVKFIGFWDYRTVAFPFLQFLLKNVRGLQEVIIDFETEGYELEITPTEVYDTSQKLLSFPRSSPDAKIMILPMTRIRWVLN